MLKFSNKILVPVLLLMISGCDQCSGPKKDGDGGGDSSTASGPIHERADVKAAVAKNEFTMIDDASGDGAGITDGQMAAVHYTGWLANGTKFDSSRDRGQPFSFKIGAGMVIKGWDAGVKDMKVGGKRVLIIPSAMGYGSRGAGGVIPPDAILVFEVELTGIQ